MNSSIIVAADSNRGIGRNNELPWYLPADLKYFKAVTTGHTVIMGRKTFESMGKALPNRRNIVISRQEDLHFKDAAVTHSLESALSLCNREDEVFIIGGAEVFRQALPVVNTLYITEIHHSFEADTFLPEINYDEWKETKRDDRLPDEKNQYPYSFVIYEKY